LHDQSTPTVTTDPVFRLIARHSGTAPRLLSGARPADGPVVGVSLRHWNLTAHDASSSPNLWEVEVASALDRFADIYGARFLFLPFQGSPEQGPFSTDFSIIQRVIKGMKNAARTEIADLAAPSEMAWRIQKLDLMIAMRYHSMIMAIAQARPLIALGYSEKIANTLHDVGLADGCVELETLTANVLFERMVVLYERRRMDAPRRREIAEHQSMVALQNVIVIRDLLSDPKCGRLSPEFAENHLLGVLLRASRLEELVNSVDQQPVDIKIAAAELMVVNYPDDPDSHLRAGRALVEAFAKHDGNPQSLVRGVEYLTASLDGGGDRYWSLFFRASARYHLKDYEAALEDIDAASQARSDRDDWRSVREAIIVALERLSRNGSAAEALASPPPKECNIDVH
jgi:hypothetical protein